MAAEELASAWDLGGSGGREGGGWGLWLPLSLEMGRDLLLVFRRGCSFRRWGSTATTVWVFAHSNSQLQQHNKQNHTTFKLVTHACTGCHTKDVTRGLEIGGGIWFIHVSLYRRNVPTCSFPWYLVNNCLPLQLARCVPLRDGNAVVSTLHGLLKEKTTYVFSIQEGDTVVIISPAPIVKVNRYI